MSASTPDPSYDDTEAALFATLQAAEYRIPYEPPAQWPLYEHEHEYVEIRTFGGDVSHIRTCCQAPSERPPPPPRYPTLPNPVIPSS